MRKLFTLRELPAVLSVLLLVGAADLAQAQLSVTTIDVAVTQNFTIGTSATATLPTGWRMGTSSNSTDWASLQTATGAAYGSTGTGAVTGSSGGNSVNWANGVTASSTERAIGFLSSNGYTSPRSIAFRFTNNTGSTITSLDVAFDYEKYRSGSRAWDWTFFHGSGTDATTAVPAGNQSYSADANNTVISNPPTTISKSFTLAGLSIADGTSYTLRWTYTGSGGSTNAQGLGLDNFSMTPHDAAGTNTSVQFTTTSATVSEGVGTYDVTVSIADFSTTDPTSVDVALVTGDGARINGFTSQTVTFPANSGAAQNVTLTVTDNASCDGQAVLTFGLENLTGGQGTPFVGPNSSRTLTINDNDGTSGHVIARQAFDGLGTDDWAITTGAGNISTNAGGGSEVPLNQRILSGTASWQVNNANGTLELGQVDVSGYSNKEITIRLTSTSTTGSGNGADVTDIVRAFVALNGGAFPGTADVEITGFSNANYGYSATGVASTAAGTPVSVSLNPGGANMAAGVSTIRISVPDGTQSIALRVTALNNVAAEVWNVDDIQITGSYCATTYYSRGSGDVGDAIWSDNPSGTAGSATFDRFKSMVVQNGDVVNINANIRIDDFTVEAGGQVDLAASILTISGDAVEIAGALTAADNSTIVLNSPDGVILESASPLDLFDLTANSADGVLTDAAIGIRGTLLLMDGEFDASLGAVTLSSTSAGTGRLGPVAGGASYTGDMTVQRYIPAGATNWRFLGSPVAGRTVNDWKDDFHTAGFPGSHTPFFDDPVGSGNLWPSVRWYDETRAFAHIDTGWVGVSSIAQELERAQGFAAWCGTGLTTTTAFTIDVTGEPHIAQSPIVRDLDYTDNGAFGFDGFNAVSNPLPSPVLFSALTRTNTAAFMYIYNPAVGNMALWDAGSSTGQNNGTDTIQSSQAFMVQALGSGASIAFEEADKVNDRRGGFFGGAQRSLFNGVRLKLTSGINGFSDEAVISFGHGTTGVDAADMPKMRFAHPDAPQIASMQDGGLYAINATGGRTTALEIPLMVDAAITGTYTITAGGMENIGLSCLVLEDLVTGIRTPLVEGASYSFTMEADASTTEPRLTLHASAPVPLYAEGTTCANTMDGRATVVHAGNAPMDITWTDATGAVILMQTIEAGVAINSELASGSYGVTVSSDAGCGALSTGFTIEAPAALELQALSADASCPNTADGHVDLTVLGGTAPYSFAWSDGSHDEDLVAAAGTYTVTITDDHGCVVSAPEFTIAAGDGPVADATPSETSTLVNMPVGFVNNSTEDASHVWEFGDGQFSTGFAPTHSWATPGIYTVTLIVDDGNCTDTWTTQVMVEAPTSIANANAANALSAWFANDKFVVEHGFSNGQPVTIDVLDATGRLHATHQFAGTPARVSVPADGLSTGIWFIRIQNDGSTRTVRVPVVR